MKFPFTLSSTTPLNPDDAIWPTTLFEDEITPVSGTVLTPTVKAPAFASAPLSQLVAVIAMAPFGSCWGPDCPTLSFVDAPTRLLEAETVPIVPPNPLPQVMAP